MKQLWVQEVDVEAMGEVVPLFYDVIAKQAGLVNGDDGEKFDMSRMSTVIRRYRRRLLEGAERRPTRSIIDGIVRNFLYGPRAGELNDKGSVTSPQDEIEALHADVDILPLLDEAETKLADYWQGLMKEFILDRLVNMYHPICSCSFYSLRPFTYFINLLLPHQANGCCSWHAKRCNVKGNF